MGKCHALAWNAVHAVFGDCDEVRLVHLAEIDETLARDRAREFGFKRSTADWRDLVRDPDVDVISVTAPNAFHAEMAVAALEAGKHVWCEKPMATRLEDALDMREAARKTGRTAVLGYNYIQNPLVRQAVRLIADGAIGAVNHVRFEMDEDFMADPHAFFGWKSEASSGYGALDDFAVHPLSLLWMLCGPVSSVMTDMAKPYADRPLQSGGRRNVETCDIASTLLRFDSGATGVLLVNRSAWGRKGRLAFQIFGPAGSILYDQERMNELQIYRAGQSASESGFQTVLAAPAHPPYDRFIPAPGHGLGFNDLKTIECRELLRRISGGDAHVIDFEKGVQIEQAVDAMARSFESGSWVDVTYE
jgi:predicted dehydrogenase